MAAGCPDKLRGSEATLVVLEIVYIPIDDGYIRRILGDGCVQRTHRDNTRKDVRFVERTEKRRVSPCLKRMFTYELDGHYVVHKRYDDFTQTSVHLCMSWALTVYDPKVHAGHARTSRVRSLFLEAAPMIAQIWLLFKSLLLAPDQ
jgi:hypothetical protein